MKPYEEKYKKIFRYLSLGMSRNENSKFLKTSRNTIRKAENAAKSLRLSWNDISTITYEEFADNLFYMRHKLYHEASEINSHQKLSGEVEIDTQYKCINLNRTRPQNMASYSKKRSKQAAYRGISHHKVAIVCATDENDHMMMQVSGLGSESFDKYKANKDYFKDVQEFISDSKASIQQFANYLEAVNNKIKTSPLEKRYLTDDGKSLGAVNEMMTEVSSMIQATRGVGTRYIQGYLDFLLFKKQAKYTFKRKEMASEILRMMMDTEAFNNEMVRATPMLISLKEAYYEYRYGIFAE